jgi:hypothetical protein
MAIVDAMTPEQRAQQQRVVTSPVRLIHEKPLDTRRVAIFCTDGGMDVEHLRELIVKGDPRAASFADADWELHDLPTGHWPMLSLPSTLAKLVGEIADR